MKQKITKQKITFTFILMISFAVIISALANAQPCMISPSFNAPLMPDSDCDGFIDPLDNCPMITNPVQQDMDENGYGDACDLYIESIRTNPSDFVFDGRTFTTVVTIVNNRDFNIRNIRVRVFLPDLGIESVQYIDNINTCQSKTLEFSLRSSICAPEGDYRIVTDVSYNDGLHIEERTGGLTSIRMVPDQNCQDSINGNKLKGKTYVNVIELKDVYKGVDTVFPIEITNLEGVDKEYEITVTGTEGWANYRIASGSVIIVPENTQRVADLYIKASTDIPPGERLFIATIKSGEEIQRFTLVAQVKENYTVDNSIVWIYSFKIIIIIVLAALLAAVIVIAISKFISKARKESSETYY